MRFTVFDVVLVCRLLTAQKALIMRGPHDVGGLPAGPVDTGPHDLEFWEKQVDGVFVSLVGKGLTRADEMRSGVEQIGHDAYQRLGYYERWTAALMRIVIAKGLLSQDEIDARMKEIRRRLGETGEVERHDIERT